LALLKKYKGESLILRAIRNMAYKIGGHDGFTTKDFDGWLRMTRGEPGRGYETVKHFNAWLAGVRRGPDSPETVRLFDAWVNLLIDKPGSDELIWAWFELVRGTDLNQRIWNAVRARREAS
jgi:hypothetical protein